LIRRGQDPPHHPLTFWHGTCRPPRANFQAKPKKLFLLFCVLSVDLLAIFWFNLLKMNDMKNTNWTSYKRQRFNQAEFEAEMARIEKQTFVLQIITSFAIGASVALGFVLIHQIYFA
jgi:hypothetical protein